MLFNYAASVMCSPKFKLAGEMVVVNNTLGLADLKNNCWFNALVQAIAFVMKSFSVSFEFVNLNEYSKKYSNLSFILATIIDCPCKEIDSEYFTNIIEEECKKCCFVFGQQQDPKEYFALSNLPYLLSSFNISCLMKCTEVYCHSCCGHIAVRSSLQSSDLQLPLFTSNKDLGAVKFLKLGCLESLTEILDKPLTCGACQKSSN